MKRRFVAVELTPRYKESATKLGTSDPNLRVQLGRTIDRFFEMPLPSRLHRHHIHGARIPGIMSSYVNKEVRIIDIEAVSQRARILNVGHHDPLYDWARHYSGADQDEIEAIVTHPTETRVATQVEPEINAETLLEYLPRADEGEECYACIPIRELMALGFTESQAHCIRRAPTDIDLKGFGIPAETELKIWHLADVYTPAVQLKQPSPAASASAPLPIPLASDDAVITLTAPGQYKAMVEMGLDRYLALLTDEQRELAEIEQTGLLVVKGSAGSGKTAIATHRVRYLADRLIQQPALLPDAGRKVLYLCYNRTLAQTVKQMLVTLYGEQPPDCIEVSTIGQWAYDYLQRNGILPANAASAGSSQFGGIRRDMLGRIRRCIRDRASVYQAHGLTPHFLARELAEVIIGRGLESREEYRKTDRAGQGKRLNEQMRDLVWDIYAKWRVSLKHERATDINLVPWIALKHLTEDDAFQPYAAVIVDETQDFTPVRLRLATQLAGNRLDRLTLFADTAQVIYTSGFRWNLAELNPRGRQVRTINRNHRNTHEIYTLAAALLTAGHESGDSDADSDVTAEPPETHGPLPEVLACSDADEEVREVCRRIQRLIRQGTPAQQIAVLAGTNLMVSRYVQALRASNIAIRSPDQTGRISITEPSVKVLTMHSAKGLDFPTVFLVDLTQTGIPGPHSGQDTGEESALSIALQRRLLYTAIVRAGHRLTLSTVAGNEHPLLADLPIELYQQVTTVAQLATVH